MYWLPLIGLLYWSGDFVQFLVRYAHGSHQYSEMRLPLKRGLVHRLQFKDQGRENIIEINKAYRIVFTDTRSSNLWWQQVEGDIRRYKSGPHSEGYGFTDVFVMIERSDQ